MEENLDDLWNGALSRIREGQYSLDDDKEIRDVLDNVPEYSDVIPKSVVTGLWFIPMFLEWQTKRVVEKSPDMEREYRILTSWVIERVGQILGDP